MTTPAQMAGHARRRLKNAATADREAASAALGARARLHGEIRRGVAAGLTKTEVADLSGLSRFTVYAILGKDDEGRPS